MEASAGVHLAVRVWEPAAAAGGPAGAPTPHPMPVLAVHGLSSNARMWDGVAEHLTRLGHTVAAVDLRGHGRSDKPDTGYDFATVAADLATVIDRLGWLEARRPLVAGQSWGGNVVLELAIRHASHVAAIACIDGGTLELGAQFATWQAVKAALSPPQLTGMPATRFEAAVRTMHPDWPETGIQGALANVEVRADGSIAPWLTVERHLQILCHLWEQRPSERYFEVPVPVLLVPAESSPADGNPGSRTAKQASIDKAAAAIPVVRTRWFKGDHDLHAQHPAELAGLLHDACDPAFWT